MVEAASAQDADELAKQLSNPIARAPTSLVGSDPETAAMKVETYNGIWERAAPAGLGLS